jgi:seryl-tRNA synthetase
MINLHILRQDPEGVASLILKKEPTFDIQRLIRLDQEVRAFQLDLESLRKEKNECADRAKSGITDSLRHESLQLSNKIRTVELQLEEVQKNFTELYLRCPNIPQADLPVGGKNENRYVHQWGEKPTFNFEVKNHVQLGTKLGWFDFEVAAAMSKSNFVLYKGDAVRLMYALTMFMLRHNQEHGYNLVLPPYIVNYQSMLNSGNFPKFIDDVFKVDGDQLYLVPTAEVNCANLHRDTIFSLQELPLRYTAWTSCFRKEAGGYGAVERGLIRIHQFEKVELYTYCEPEESNNELERMLACAESLLQKLGLHYRVMLLAAQDCSFSSARTYDIEVWMPGQRTYYEVSSCSNCTDFQARRAAVRYRAIKQSKPEFVHTLNGSSLALPRLMVALMESGQQADGSIVLPEVLKQFTLI